MHCHQAQDLLSARLDGELGPDELALLNHHVQECAMCRTLADRMQQQDQELRHLFAPRRAAATTVAQQVLARLPQVPAEEWNHRQALPPSPFAFHRPRRLTAVLLAIAVLVGLVLLVPQLLQHQGPDHSQPATAHNDKKPRSVTSPAPSKVAATVPTATIGETVRTGAGERRQVRLPDGSVLYLNQNTILKIEGERKASLEKGEVYVHVAPRRPDTPRATFHLKTPQREVTALGTRFDVQASERGTGVLVTQGKVQVTGLKPTLHAGQKLLPGGDALVPTPRVSHLLDWARDLIATESARLVPESRYDGGALVAVDPYGQATRLTLRRYHIDVHIEDGFARTTIDQTYFNPDNWRMEGTFYFPLPPDASLSRLAMYVDGRLMEGGMAERDFARNIYEQVLYRQRDPALLEWIDGSTFKMRVFPLEPRQEKRLVLSYTQRLETLYGQIRYRFPAGHTLPSVRDWSFHAIVKNGQGVGWSCDSHRLKARTVGDDLILDGHAKNVRPDRDVVLDLNEPENAPDVRFSTAVQDGAKYLMVRYRAALGGRAGRVNALEAHPHRNWVFLFESSGDRDSLLARTQTAIIRTLLANTEHDDTFTILTAGTRVHTFPAQGTLRATPDNIEQATNFLSHSRLIGALDLGHALEAAQPILHASQNSWLVHVGSGVAAMGEKRDDALAAKVPDGVHYVGIGVGKRWKRSFMKVAAERTGGYFTQINPDDQIAWRAFDLLATLNTPRLLNIRVVDNSEKLHFLTVTSLLAQGEELAAIARLEPGQTLPQTITVAGQLDDQPWHQVLLVQELAEHADYLPRTWAKLRIEELLTTFSHDPTGRLSDREHQQKVKDQVIALSKSMYVMTPFTSLLVLENEEMYARFKVDRGRKDQWARYPLPARIPVVTEPDPLHPGAIKGKQKPTADQVLQTILVRVPARFLAWPGVQAPFNGQPVVNAWQLYGGGKASGGREAFFANGFISGITVRPASGGPTGGRFAPALGLPLSSANRSDFMGKQVFDEFGYSAGLSGRHAQLGDIRDKNGTVETVPLPGLGSIMTLSGTDKEVMEKAEREVAAAATPPPPAVPQSALDGRYLMTTLQVDRSGLGMPVEEKVAVLGNAPATDQGALRSLITTASAGGSAMHAPLAAGLNAPAAGDEPPIFFPPAANFKELTLLRRAAGAGTGPKLLDQLWTAMTQAGALYQRPSFSGDDRVFYDLVAYAPGMNTSYEDIQAVLDAEALPRGRVKPGTITPAARQLIERARQMGWQKLTIPGGSGQPDLHIFFNGRGQFVYERTAGLGLHEKVICDGQTLLHVYPDLGIGARRAVSRFHRAGFRQLLPWLVPPADDLIHGCDITCSGEHTVVITPQGAATARDAKGKAVAYRCLHLVFGHDGRLVERQLVSMPERKIVAREVYDANGSIRVLDGKGKQVAEEKCQLARASAPSLRADTRGLVVLPLPWRTRDHVVQEFKIPANPNLEDMPEHEALALFAADFASNNAEATQVFGRRFYGRDIKWLGFYTFLAAAGVNVDAEQQYLNLMAEHPADTLAKYLAFHSNPELRRHAHWGELNSPQQGMLHRLAAFRVLWMHWQAEPAQGGSEAERRQALQFVHDNHSPLGWALLGLLQQKAGKHTKFLESIAAGYHAYATSPELGYLSRYEEARSLLQGQRRAEARRLYLKIYGDTLKQGILPPIDSDFRLALQSDKQLKEKWTPLVRQTARKLVKDQQRLSAVALAWQCWQLGDQALADNALTAALEQLPDGERRLLPTLAAIEFLLQTNQPVRADDLLRPILADKQFGQRPGLWRLGMRIAEARKQTPRSLACLERALALEAEHLPPVINLNAVRTDYGALLEHYQQVVDAMATLQVKPPADFAERVVQAADRWRQLDHDNATPCQTAGKILEKLGKKDLAWEFLTTPVGLQPNEAGPWVSLAQAERTEGDYELADRAYQAAFESEPTDAQILWERAQTLQQAGRRAEAQKLYRQLADGHWQPRFTGLQSQARWQLENR